MLLFAVWCSAITASSFGARILGIVPITSYSHQVVFHPMWRELSLRGHQLTVISTDPINDKSLTNLTEIDLHYMYERVKKKNIVEMSQKGVMHMLMEWARLAAKLSESELLNPKIQKLIKDENEHFDLLMVEGVNPLWFAFAERFKCPLIALYSMDAQNYNYELIRNPSHPVLNPDFMLPFAGKLTFFERLISVGFSVVSKVFNNCMFYPPQQKLVEKYFGSGYPLLQDIFRNTSLVFININPFVHQFRPWLPSVISIGGGTHLKPPKPLPKDLQKQLDGATQGVIYFSLGSNVKSREVSEEARLIILETFAELSYLVLWKFELEDLPGKPDNVIISKWYPQQDVLRHHNIKLFITQGGIQSTEEAVYNHVPLVGMPFMGDQPANVARFVSRGLGKSVDYKTLDKKTFRETILEVIDNAKYRNRIIALAQLAKDEPMTGLERAVWWTEYVLRNKGAAHLRSPAIDLPTYQYFLLDVIGFCLLVIVTAVYVTVKVTKLIFKLTVKFSRLFKSEQKTKRE